MTKLDPTPLTRVTSFGDHRLDLHLRRRSDSACNLERLCTSIGRQDRCSPSTARFFFEVIYLGAWAIGGTSPRGGRSLLLPSSLRASATIFMVARGFTVLLALLFAAAQCYGQTGAPTLIASDGMPEKLSAVVRAQVAMVARSQRAST